MKQRFVASLLLVFSSASFAGHLRAQPKTVFYYSQKSDGSLKFTDEPPLEAPRARTVKKSYLTKKSSFHDTKKTVAVASLTTFKEPDINDTKFEAVVYVPQSEIEVSFSPVYTRKSSNSLRASYQEMIRQAALEHRVEPALIAAIIKTESGNNPKAISHKGARGLMQLMPQTAAGLGVQNIHDPEQNIRGGTKYIKKLLTRYHGNVDLALAAYNAGHGAVEKYRGVPPYRETIDYIARVRKYYRQFENF